MKTRAIGTLFMLGSLLLTGCTGTPDATNPPGSDTPAVSSSPTEASAPSVITISPVDTPGTQTLENSAGFIGTRRLTDAYGAPLTLAGVRAPETLTSPVSDWVDAQAETFTIAISQLPDPSAASLTMTPSQCGAAGTLFCYSIASTANFPLPGTEGNTSDTADQSTAEVDQNTTPADQSTTQVDENTTQVDQNTTVEKGTATASPSSSANAESSETPDIPETSFDTRTTFKAWMTDFSQGTVVDTVDLLSSEGKKELYAALAAFLGGDVPAESTESGGASDPATSDTPTAPATSATPAAPDFLDAVFINADGSLTLAVTRGALFNPEVDMHSNPEADAHTDTLNFEIRENVAGTITSYLTPEGAALRDTILSQAAPVAIPESPVDCNKLSCVALTFDDGPGEYTAQLLDILAEKKVKATFFVIGRAAANNPDLIAREVNEGHVVGNHTWSHPKLSTLKPDAIAAEIDQTDQAIMAAGAPAPILVRPPYGAQNSTVRQVLAGRGEIAVLWSIDTLDWKNRNVAVDTRQAVDRTQPGSIILMHDIHPETVQAVPEIIDELENKGFVLVTVPELLGDGYEQYAGMTVYSQQRIF